MVVLPHCPKRRKKVDELIKGKKTEMEKDCRADSLGG